MKQSLLSVPGLALIIAGLWMAWPPLALIIAGSILVGAVIDV